MLNTIEKMHDNIVTYKQCGGQLSLVIQGKKGRIKVKKRGGRGGDMH